MPWKVDRQEMFQGRKCSKVGVSGNVLEGWPTGNVPK